MANKSQCFILVLFCFVALLFAAKATGQSTHGVGGGRGPDPSSPKWFLFDETVQSKVFVQQKDGMIWRGNRLWNGNGEEYRLLIRLIPKEGALLVGKSGVSHFPFSEEVKTVRLYCDSKEIAITETKYQVIGREDYKSYADFSSDPKLKRAIEDCPGRHCEISPGFRFSVLGSLQDRLAAKSNSFWARLMKKACDE